MSVTEAIKREAMRLGFDRVAVTTAEPFDDAEAVFVDRIERGLFDGIPWLTAAHAHRACTPREHISQARSVIALATSYLTEPFVDLSKRGDPRGRVSRYAWGPDYHGFIADRAERLCSYLRERHGANARPKACVDSSAVAERAVAHRAGLGWFGKSTMLLSPTHGSWMFLAEIITDLELEPDRPIRKTCGACTHCMTACPTGALDTAYELDARRCISYLTIEHRGVIARELRSRVGTWIFGCDVCQEVCPVNRKALPARQEQFEAAGGIGPSPSLLPLLELDEVDFRQRFRYSAVRRARRSGLVRNACIALGNAGDRSAVGPLGATLVADPDPVVRQHAAWALGRLGGHEAMRLLQAAYRGETEPAVREEIALGLDDDV